MKKVSVIIPMYGVEKYIRIVFVVWQLKHIQTLSV